MLEVGKKAPSFSAQAYQAGKFVDVNSDNLRGSWVILFFYPADFTFVCPTEIKGFAKAASQFEKLGTKVIGASTDSVHSHRAWYERDMPEVKYPVLADTKHEVARAYGVFDEEKGLANRGTFIIDPQGVLRYFVVSDLNVGRSIDETLRVVEALQAGGLCPADWKHGEKLIEAK